MPPNTRFSSYIKPGLLEELPFDLKREILEITAYVHPPFAPRLALVSKEVKTWAERIIYRELFFDAHHNVYQREYSTPTPLEKFQVAISARPASFFAEYVRSLHFVGRSSPSQILPIIHACSGVTNFGLYATWDAEYSSRGWVSDDDDEDEDREQLAWNHPRAQVYQAIHALKSLDTLFISGSHIPALLKQLPADTSTSSLTTLSRLGLTDAHEYPAEHFPALTHLALLPEAEGRVIPSVAAALEKSNPRIKSIIAMLNYANTPRETATLQALRDVRATDERLVLFTMPVSATRYIEDDLWDLANEFPDEDQPITFLEEIPGPRILSFQELMALGL
ncbi:hypothetical protein DXG03_005988 [Asterophora parasitica]|uniref:Uncharacterized protein n=1 Tax=Asterophora parasitica TaxID=117018 RepID=A0A9P7KAQ3_9AGAR|nr:hypothetical protein DXG03_005988 [Asterophora parasitica]